MKKAGISLADVRRDTGPATPEGPKIYTVRELTRQIRTLIESNFPAIWVEGEISGFKHHHSGHM